jgi:hypothetical protein
MRGHCEICGRPDYIECNLDYHVVYEAQKRAKVIALEEPEELLP